MSRKTKRLERWASDFGIEYTDRNDIPISLAEQRSREFTGRSITESFEMMLTGLKISRVLEVGCNVGQKLEVLSSLGNYNLYGLEPQVYALRKARSRLIDINFIEGDAFDIPFKDNFFDLVFTSGVLIHIAPDDLPKALNEIYRVSRKYILGFEYYSKDVEMVNYRGEDEMLWKMDFEGIYLKLFPGLETVKSEILEYHESAYNKTGLFEKHFLLSKSN